jgi:hypothetical protein
MIDPSMTEIDQVQLGASSQPSRQQPMEMPAKSYTWFTCATAMASIECCGVPLAAVTSAGTVKCGGNERQILGPR